MKHQLEKNTFLAEVKATVVLVRSGCERITESWLVILVTASGAVISGNFEFGVSKAWKLMSTDQPHFGLWE